MRTDALVFGSVTTSSPPHVAGGFTDPQLPGGEVQIPPLEGDDLPQPHTRGQLQQEQFVESVLPCLDQKPLHFLLCQDLHLGAFLRRKLAPGGGIESNQLLLHRPFQRRIAGHVALPHHGIRQACTMPLHQVPPPALFQAGKKLL